MVNGLTCVVIQWRPAITQVVPFMRALLPLQRPLAPAAAEQMPSLATSKLDFASRCIAADTPSR
jgi:hypothetical protein